jgi:rhodanese-related sulfurtransferase
MDNGSQNFIGASVATPGAPATRPGIALVYWQFFAGRSLADLPDHESMEQYLEFIGNHTLLVGGLFFTFFLLVFTELRRKALGVTSIEPQDAVKLINNDAVVIDLRSAEAFARGHIVHARNIPFDELSVRADALEKYKAKTIVAVCDAGMTSGKTVQMLRKAGINDVYGLRGGIAAWTQANLPLVTAKKTKKKT